jgi:hypothetical protein
MARFGRRGTHRHGRLGPDRQGNAWRVWAWQGGRVEALPRVVRHGAARQASLVGDRRSRVGHGMAGFLFLEEKGRGKCCEFLTLKQPG